MQDEVPERGPQLVVSAEAAGYVRAHGGKLYIWTQRQVCCRGRTTRRAYADVEEPEGRSFRRASSAGTDIECYLAVGVSPPEITVAMSRLGERRPVAHWPGVLRG